jgi:REP element-mobilizing transposase RayT
MATPRRTLYPGAAYHVTVRTVDGRTLYDDDGYREAFLLRLAKVVAEHRLICDAYCLMTNHFHLLLRTPYEGLPAAMQQLDTWLAISFNRRRNRRGRVLEAPYGAVLIERQEHLLEVARYVVLNPVRAGMLQTPGAWPWSSYRATAGLAPRPRFLTVDWLLGQLGGPDRYGAFVSEGSPAASLAGILLAP